MRLRVASCPPWAQAAASASSGCAQPLSRSPWGLPQGGNSPVHSQGPGVGKGQALGLDGLGDLWQAMAPLWMSRSHTRFYKLPQSASLFWPVQPTSTAPLGQALCRVLDGQQTRPRSQPRCSQRHCQLIASAPRGTQDERKLRPREMAQLSSNGPAQPRTTHLESPSRPSKGQCQDVGVSQPRSPRHSPQTGPGV